MISRKGLYAVRATLFLARRHGGQPVSVDEIASDEGISRKFLETIMQDLKKAGILHSHRGKKGGYTLRETPQRLTIGRIVRAIDGPPVTTCSAHERCEDCPGEGDCLIRVVLHDVTDAITKVLDFKSVEQMLHERQSVHGVPMYDI
ncbi:MAG: RrF2 family transcriptional regulator [Chthoniobacteraceae bacterium]